MSSRKIRLVLSTLILACTGLLVSSPGSGQDTHLIPRGARIPDFRLQALEGKTFRRDALEGRPVVIVFLRARGEASRTVLRDLARLAETLDGKRWERVAIFSGDAPVEAVRALVEETRFKGHVLLDPDRTAYRDFGVIAVPSVVLGDSHGRVLYSRAPYGVRVLEELEKTLAEALGVPAAGTRRTPRDPRLQLALRLVEIGDARKALAVLEKVVAEKPEDLDARLLLARAARAAGEPKLALEVLENAPARANADPRLEVERASTLAALGRLREAEVLSRKVVERHPDLWEAHAALGAILEKSGDKDGALAAYKAALRILERCLRDCAH